MSLHKANVGAWFVDKLGLNPAGRMMRARPRWLCTKCGKHWITRGMHPDCDGEAADMVETHAKIGLRYQR